MALAWTITDSQARNIYTRMYNYYNSPNNLPDKSGVFFGYSNFTKDKLEYCIQYLKGKFGRGWFTADFSKRSDVLHALANDLYGVFGGTVNVDGIYKFLTWVYTFAKNDAKALNYFQKGYYSIIDGMADAFKEKVIEPVNEAAETVTYGIKYPVLSVKNPVFKWVAIAAAGVIFYKLIK